MKEKEENAFFISKKTRKKKNVIFLTDLWERGEKSIVKHFMKPFFVLVLCSEPVQLLHFVLN